MFILVLLVFLANCAPAADPTPTETLAATVEPQETADQEFFGSTDESESYLSSLIDVKVQISTGIIQWSRLNQELSGNPALFDDEAWRSDAFSIISFIQNAANQLSLSDHPEGEGEIEEKSNALIESLYDLSFEYENFLNTGEGEAFSKAFDAASNSLNLLEEIGESIDSR